MAGDPPSVASQIEALRRFFLLRYREEVRDRYLALKDLFPLFEGSRLDQVHVNGGRRTHFLYQRGTADEHLVVIHDITLETGNAPEDQERALVERAVEAQEPLAHFVVLPPYEDRFDEVEQEAVAAVRRHARRRPDP